MHRRNFFTSIVTGVATATAGCLSGTEESNERGGGEENDGYEADISYRRCTETFVPRGEIPPEISDEVETALSDGEYVADELAYPALVSDNTKLWEVDDNRYYTHRVNTDGSMPKLVFEETTPAHEDSGEIKISNQTTGMVEIKTTISTGDDVLTDSELSVDPADEIVEVEDISNNEYAGEEEAAEQLPGIEFPDEFRDYEVEVVIETVENEHTETTTIGVHPWFEYYWIQISDDGILADGVWENDRGFFSEGPVDSKMGVHWECTEPPAGWPKKQD